MRKSLLFLCLILSFSSFSQRTLIYAGKLIDGTNNRMLKERTIIIEGSSITTAVDRGYTGPEEGDITIDLKSMTVAPGLIDMHVHIEGGGDQSGSIFETIHSK